jgi:hypothetical protein
VCAGIPSNINPLISIPFARKAGDRPQTPNNRPFRSRNFLPPVYVLEPKDMVMKAYLANLPTSFWALIALPALVVTRCVVATVVPQVVHAVVPEVVRTVLRII